VIEPGRVPGLGDQRYAGECGRELDGGGEGRIGQRLAVLATHEDAGQIEAEAIDTVLLDPDLERAQQGLRDQRVIAVDGVAAAGVVAQYALVVVIEGFRHQALVVEDRALCAALGCVVEHHVEYHADVRRVQRLHEGAELIGLAGLVAIPAVAGVRAAQ
jgi:hypothetical protein